MSSNSETPEQILYVLEARPGTLRNSANYLKNRGWKIQGTTKVKEFLALVMGAQPPLVMICIDHPNPTAGNLAKLIGSAFPNTRVVAFVDGTSSASVTKLKNSKNEYSVYPPLSGPAIERVILRVQKDQQKAAELPNTNADGSGGEGTKSTGGDAVVIKGRGMTAAMAEQARNMLAQFMSTDEGPDATGDTSYHDSASSEARRSSAILSGRRSLKRRLPPPKMDFSPAGGWKLREFTPESEPRDQNEANPTNPTSSSDLSRSKDAPTFETAGRSRKTKRVPKFTQAEASLIIKATDTALDATVIKGQPTVVAEKIAATTSVACIAVESVKFTGYLVAALGKNRKIDEKFIAAVREHLVAFMRNAGEDFSADEALDLNLHQVAFEDWALTQAEFLRKSIHDGQEIAMAFFPEEINRRPLEASASQKMLKLDIEELVGNATMEFDLYVHLPTNNKYILYTRQDQTLHADQLDRLKTKGVQSMHLRKEDETNVRRYRIRNFLNDKIKEHLDDELSQTEGAS
jgi:hypothetical protein